MAYYVWHIAAPNFSNGEFFKAISNTLSKTLTCYDIIVLADDLNIDLLDPSKDTSDHLPDLLDVFNLKNLVKEPTCFMPEKGSLVDIILTNKPTIPHINSETNPPLPMINVVCKYLR